MTSRALGELLNVSPAYDQNLITRIQGAIPGPLHYSIQYVIVLSSVRTILILYTVFRASNETLTTDDFLRGDKETQDKVSILCNRKYPLR